MKGAIFNWSGGKDSAIALHKIMQSGEFDVKTLLTSINSETDRISMHGVRQELLREQANCIGLPLSVLELPGQISMAEYDELMSHHMQELKKLDLHYSIFGDIFLEDLRQYREDRLKEVGLKGHFPLWQRDTTELIHEFIDLGFKTIVVAVDGSKLDKSFAGRVIDQSFLADLPTGIDPCGENGEFHTFVFEGPIFNSPLNFELGEVVGKSYELNQDSKEQVTYWFQDLVLKRHEA